MAASAIADDFPELVSMDESYSVVYAVGWELKNSVIHTTGCRYG
jgi:hypothetical protein